MKLRPTTSEATLELAITEALAGFVLSDTGLSDEVVELVDRIAFAEPGTKAQRNAVKAARKAYRAA